MQKKKIIFVIGSLHLGGAEKSLVNLLQLLDYSKVEVTLLVFVKGGALENSVPKEVRILYEKIPRINIFRRIKYSIERIITPNTHPVQIHWKYIKDLFSPIKEIFDIGIAYNQGFATYYVSQFINSEIKYFWQNSDYIKAKYDVDLDIPYFKNYNGIVAVSELAKHTIEKALLTRDFRIPIKIIKDISNKKKIVEDSLEKINIEFSKSYTNIVTVGRLVKPKGLYLAVESCRKLITAGYKVKWYLIGEGPERKYLEKLINKYSLQENFLLLGAKSNPYPYIKKSDIYVQTSLFEGLGLTLIEALYLHKPIVTTNFDTAYLLIENSKTGLIVEKNEDDISNGIIKFINDLEFKTEIINNISELEDSDTEDSLEKINELIFSER